MRRRRYSPTGGEVDVLPRTQWNVDGTCYVDRSRTNDLVTKTALIHFHVYL
jgi:hypothetical protein